MKKLTLISILLLSFLILLTACGGGNEICQHRDADDDSLCDKCSEDYTDGDDSGGGHIHSYTLKNIDDAYLASSADCEKAAEYYFSCTCGEKGDTTFINGVKLEHDEEPHSAKAPTCTEKGWDAYVTCSRCDYTTYAEKAALEHDEQSHDAKAPTCTEVGWDAYVTCSRCDYTTYLERATLEHDEQPHDAKAPTCTEVGWDAYVTCSRCDYTTYAEKAALEHDEQTHDAKAPTCTEVGWDAYVTCSRCDYTTYVEKGVIDHVYSSTLKHNSTHHYYECSCGAKKDEVKHVSSGAATANKDEVCTVCGYVINKAVGISFNSLTVDGTNVYGKVSNDTMFYSFINEVNTFGGAKYIVSTKITGENPVTTKTIDLEVGGNTVYVIEMIDDEPSVIYKVVIRRRPVYEVTFNTNSGTAVGPQFVEEDSLATAPLTTRVGYTFAGWSYDFSTPVTSDIRVTANWNPNTNTPYRVEYYLENLEDSGYTLTETENLFGTTDTTATAEQKVFEHFTFNSAKSVMSGNIAGDGSLVLKVYYTRDSYTIKTTVTDSKGGSLTVGGTYPYGTEIKLSATVNAGYSFFGYFAGDDKLCETTDYIFTVSENLDIVTKIEANEDTPYKVEYYLENLEDSGYTLTETENLFGTTDTTATAEQKVFEHFTFNSAKSVMSGNIAGDGSLVLKVYYTRDKYTIKTSVTDAKGGSLTVGGTYPYGTEIKLSATVNAGYSFFGYFAGDDKLCETTDYIFTVSENLDIVTKIEANEDTPYKVEYYLENLEDSGYTLTETENLFGTTDTTATAEQKVFEHFTFNSAKSVMNGNIAGDGSLVLRVYYRRSIYELTNANSAYGSITKDGLYKYGSATVTAIATPNLGYEFIGWYSGDELISTETAYAFVAERNIEAKFVVRATMANFTFTSTATTCEITGIRDNAVTKITVPDCVTSISFSAFSGCNNLVSITIPFVGATDNGTSNTHFGYIFGASTYNYNNDHIPKSLNTVAIIGGTNISDYAFYECYGLTSVVIPNTVTSIGNYAFSGCHKLVEVINKSSLDINVGSSNYGRVAEYAKEVHNGESKIVNKDGYLFYTYNGVNYLLGYVGDDTDITLPNRYDGENYEIYEYAFYGSSNITAVTIPDGVSAVGLYAFNNCTRLEKITIPFVGNKKNGAENTHFGYIFGAPSYEKNNLYIPSSLEMVIISGGDNIESYAFQNCNTIKNIVISSDITKIGFSAFNKCDVLESIEVPFVGAESEGSRNTHFGYIFGADDYSENYYVPATLKNVTITGGYIYSCAFHSCDSIETVYIENASIADKAFYYCYGLKSVTIGDGVNHIGSYAFGYCWELTTVTIGRDVTSISIYAFYNCDSLRTAIFKQSVGWHCSSVSFQLGLEVPSNQISNKTTAATYLRSSYMNNYWTRK